MPSPIFCALDTPDLDQATSLARRVAPHVAGVKLGLEFFIANGPAGVLAIKALGLPIFLDLKLHDIPNTIAGAIKSAAELGVDFLTIHTSGAPEMMRRAIEAADGKVKLLGVTVLTSLDDGDLQAVGQNGPVVDQVLRLAELARSCGLPGLVCSPAEVAALREACGEDTILVVPGIRPAEAVLQDQKRVMTPELAMEAGASYLVIGRPITGASDPGAAAAAIATTLAKPQNAYSYQNLRH